MKILKVGLYQNAGLVIMGTKNTEVALSYKSVDYLSFGLPLINSAKHDTMRLINSQDAGFNFDDNQIGVLVNKLSKISYRIL